MIYGESVYGGICQYLEFLLSSKKFKSLSTAAVLQILVLSILLLCTVYTVKLLLSKNVFYLVTVRLTVLGSSSIEAKEGLRLD